MAKYFSWARKSESQPTILLDLDDVLADFIGGACHAHGWTRERLEAVRQPGNWWINEAMGINADREFWAPIDALGEVFWTRLAPLPWLPQLLRVVSTVTDDWWVVTSPSKSVWAPSGKVKWMRYHLPHSWDYRYHVTNGKHLLVRPNTILIDDREETVMKFCHAGGIGILFPTRGGSLYPLADDPVSYIEQELNTFTYR